MRFLLQVVRIVEVLEGKGLHMALTQGEAQLIDYLQGVMHQVRALLKFTRYDLIST